MCDFITPALMIASTVVAATSTAIQASTAANQARAQAKMEEAAAADAMQRGADEAGRVRTAASLAIGEGKASVAKAGLEVGEGSPLDALTSIRSQSELDAGLLRSNAARTAWGHTAQAGSYNAAAANAELQGGLSMGATFLEGAAGMTKYYANRNGWNKPPPTTPAPGYAYTRRGTF